MSGVPGSARKYGVQVGNETYSLVITQEDWEKRRQDRENARKLSLANNKRRKALDDRKRVAEARENRKRELELFKRRQRQIEATERYQRFHITAKDKRAQSADLTKPAPKLEEVLQKLRGDGDGTIGIIPVTEKQSTSGIKDTNSIGSIDKRQNYPVVMERAHWQNMKEYAEDIKRQILNLQNIDNELKDSLELDQNGYAVDDDGQDSLHGSSISGSSQPSYSSVTLTKPGVDTVTPPEHYPSKINTLVPPETSISEPHIPSNEKVPENMNNMGSNPGLHYHNFPQGEFEQSQSNVAMIRGSETGVLCKRDSQTGRITYYVKAYRPWSASVSNKTFQNTFSHTNGPAAYPLRPSSSYESTHKAPVIEYNTVPKPPQRQYDTWTASSNTNSGYITQHSKKLTDATIGEAKTLPPRPKSVQFAEPVAEAKPLPSGNRASSAPLRQTRATPVTTYNNLVPKTSSIFIPGSATPLIASVTNFNGSAQAPLLVDDDQHKPSLSSTSVTYTPNVSVPLLSNIPSTETESLESTQKLLGEARKLKGILRRHSKYDSSPTPARFTPSHPAYQSAGLARQKWLHGISLTPTPPDSVPDKEPRVRSAEAKSVRWHQVQYNDGTSSALDGSEIPPPALTLTPKPQPPVRASPRVRSPKKPPARPKTSPGRGMKGGKVRTGGRRLRPAKEVPVNVVPHPPQKQTPKLSMSTVINYSIDPEENMPPKKDPKQNGGSGKAPLKSRPMSSTKRMSPLAHNKIMFHRKMKSENGEAVTMSTLKSRGNDPRLFDGRNFENVVVSHGNQVTINVSSSKPIMSMSTPGRRVPDTGRIPLNGTPTDQEIEMLWDKVRAYLAWNRSRGNPPLVKKMRGSPERKIAWNSPQPEPTKPISANIISIDGGIFGKTSNQDDTTQHQHYKSNHQMPVHYERFGIAKSRKVAYSPTAQMQEYGYVANHGTQYHTREKVRSTIPVVLDHHHPPSAPVRRQPQLTDSVKTFRLVEALIEQNVPEEEILKALNTLQSATREV